MLVTIQTFWLPKAGNSYAEYEDAFWPVESLRGVALSSVRCAIADGATETSFSAEWARQLTKQWCEARYSHGRWLRSLPALGGEWLRERNLESLPWYSEEKVRSGAYSSLLGVSFFDECPDRGWPARWEAVALGDSCLSLFRGNELAMTFPIASSIEFNTRPYLLCSISHERDSIISNLHIVGGKCRIGDVFYLMTDALACWLLSLDEVGQPAFTYINDISTQEQFEGLVTSWRADLDHDGRPYLKNDDVTLVRIHIHE